MKKTRHTPNQIITKLRNVEAARGKILSPTRKCDAVRHVQKMLDVSERRACRTIGQPRSTQHYQPRRPGRDGPLTARIQALATENLSYGYRFVTVLLKREGWMVNPKRVHRLWRQAGLSHRP